MKEEWVVIPNYEDYMVSTKGRIKSLKRSKEKILTPIRSGKVNKTDKIKLYKDGDYDTVNIATIMGNAFLGRKKGQIIRHKDKDIFNNNLDNLYLIDIS